MKNIFKSSNDTPTQPPKGPGKKDDKARAKALRDNLLKRKEQIKKREEDKKIPEKKS